MQRPLHEHILALETILQDLHDQLPQTGLSSSARDTIVMRIKFANDALSHYRQAYELEHILATPDTSLMPTEAVPHGLNTGRKISPVGPDTN